MSEQTINLSKRTLVVTRIIDAPVEKVWRAWTDPEQVKQWWGPEFYTAPYARIDLREGGQYVFAMRAPAEFGGGDSFTAGVYSKIVPLERLEFTQGLADADGKRMDPAQAGMPPDFPPELHTVITFKARGQMTELIITEESWTMGQMYVYSYAGTQQMIDKLAAYLSERA